jgi:poly [ADP-ribose] polymerase
MEEVKNPVYLVMVTGDDNHNKFYRMIPNGNTFTVEYGRIGVGGFQTSSYPISQFYLKYNEKIKKGYVDQSHLVADLIVKEKKKEYIDIENPSIAKIVERLQTMAKQAISENYTISSAKVTKAMVDEAQITLTNLISTDTTESFNKILIDLFKIIPRKMSKVSDYLANNRDNFSNIVQREQDLLDIMKGQVVQQQVESNEPEDNNEVKQLTILDALGLKFADITDLDKMKINSALGSCSNKFFQAWRVENNKTQMRFDKYVQSAGNPETKLLWHGSRNENWWSIINSGLVLRPTNAIITGKMFGNGCYYSPTARKSMGYTSLKGSYWVNGNSNIGFMALMNVAYGKPYDVYSFDSKFYDFDYDQLQKACQGANCLHAHAGSMLKNDEIVVYKENQMTISYLVEIKE